MARQTGRIMELALFLQPAPNDASGCSRRRCREDAGKKSRKKSVCGGKRRDSHQVPKLFSKFPIAPHVVFLSCLAMVQLSCI